MWSISISIIDGKSNAFKVMVNITHVLPFDLSGALIQL